MYIKTYAQVEFLALRFDEFHDNIILELENCIAQTPKEARI